MNSPKSRPSGMTLSIRKYILQLPNFQPSIKMTQQYVVEWKISLLSKPFRNHKRQSRTTMLEIFFLKWLRSEHPECWGNDDLSPVLQRISSTMMCTSILLNSINKDGTMESYSTAEGHRSMMVNLFKKEKMRLPETFGQEWEDYSRRYENKNAAIIAAGLTPSAGSDKLNFKDNNLLIGVTKKSECFYAHGFLVLSLNLMVRSGIT